MKILLIFRFGWLIVKFMFQSYFEKKNDKVSTFNVVHFPNFEISTSLELAPHLTLKKKFISAAGAYGMSPVGDMVWALSWVFLGISRKISEQLCQRAILFSCNGYSRRNRLITQDLIRSALSFSFDLVFWYLKKSKIILSLFSIWCLTNPSFQPADYNVG